MKDNTETVTISKERYEELLDSESKLYYLAAGGVDNWEWYDESLKPYWAEKDGNEDED